MMQEVKQTHDEKVAMYMKCTKRQLIEMLINCNELLENPHASVVDMLNNVCLECGCNVASHDVDCPYSPFGRITISQTH